MKKILTLLILLITISILTFTGLFQPVDIFICEKMQLITTDYLTIFMKIITYLGNTISVLLFHLLLLVYLFIKRKNVKDLIIVAIISAIVNFTIKNIVKRPRPLGSLIKETGYSFPSGHAQNNTVFYRHIIKIFESKVVMYISYLLIFLIAISRVYLRVHYFSDVVTGFLIGNLIFEIYFYIKKYDIIK